MTRFARAKGSKASNEKLPESATSWSEMKRELLNKNKDLEENKNREKVMQQRQANYQAFLQETEDAEGKNVSWADFPEAQDPINKQKSPSTFKKRKLNDGLNKANSSATHFKNKKAKTEISVRKNADFESEESDVEFSALKSQIDKVLDNQKASGSDSDEPPQEMGIKEEPKKVIVKKAKRPKQKLQILINQEEKSKSAKTEQNFCQGQQTKSTINEKPKKENLSDKEKKKIEQKQERYKKQLEKKKLTKHMKTIKNAETITMDGETSSSLIGHVVEKGISQNSSETDAKRLEKKLERRKKQKEKKLKKRLDGGLINTLENKKIDEVLTEKDLANIQKKKERRARQADKRKKFREAKALAAENAETNNTAISDQNTTENDGQYNSKANVATNFNGNELRNEKVMDTFKINKGNTDLIQRQPYNQHPGKQPNTNKEKKAKLKEKDFQRKQTKPETMFINGKTIEIDYVDGFPVKKEDADRLKNLRKEMISKGLPRSEINIALKLERRRAEKAFAREKKNVCFNCRKSGHNLSECPELGKDQVVQTAGTGICFKCGSTEHTHYECKVVKGLDYKFATCFICKEQGHISRQCPDNQRGLYPKGGSCNVCGDVTHLKKDCPKYQTQQYQLQSSLSIETLDNRNPDDFGSKGDTNNASGPVKKFSKIKF